MSTFRRDVMVIDLDQVNNRAAFIRMATLPRERSMISLWSEREITSDNEFCKRDV